MKPLKMMLVVTGNGYLLLSFGFLVHVFGNGSSSFSMAVHSLVFNIHQGFRNWTRAGDVGEN